MKVVINTCFGGFDLSDEALSWLDKNGYKKKEYEEYTDYRSDPLIVKCVEKLGKKADGRCAKLKVVTIPDGVEYTIDDYDDVESIHEKHRSWG